MLATNKETGEETMDFEEDEEELENGWEDWEGDEDAESNFLCLFCHFRYSSCLALFDHCSSAHHFNFQNIRKNLCLDFYGSFKLINFVRFQVAENICWACGVSCQSNQDLQNHLHERVSFNDNLPWDDAKYLQPYMQDDSVLYSFNEDDEEGESDYNMTIDKEELLRDLRNIEDICIDDKNAQEARPSDFNSFKENEAEEIACVSSGCSDIVNHECVASSDRKPKDKHLSIHSANIEQKEMKNVNESYFGSYSSFGIHREMLSDTVRTDAYRQAILDNPSLLNGAVVLDVGCGTGILSLFAALAGASRVIAVEASGKMAAVATQIAKDNGLLCQGDTQSRGVIEVVPAMLEELDKSIQIQPNSVDVLISEWMGYCLLYESMLSSVLFARDKWLKPGGAILPDTATIFVAGFGRGGTSFPFWDNVYGFDMSCVGKELVENAAQTPIVDVLDSCDIVTNSVILKEFDLVKMEANEMDFTSTIELQPNLDTSTRTKCYGVVLWFETGFTDRFCKETPTVLSTSPYTQKTHWSQTILTFLEPIAMAAVDSVIDRSAVVGSDDCPAVGIHLRISIARGTQYRSIDISLETEAFDCDGRKHCYPAQICNLN